MRAGTPALQGAGRVGETPALPGGAGFNRSARRSTPKPRRGFQALSEGFSPQSPRAGETFALPGSGEWQTGCLPFVPTAVLTKVEPGGQG